MERRGSHSSVSLSTQHRAGSHKKHSKQTNDPEALGNCGKSFQYSSLLAPISASVMQVSRNTGFGPQQCSRSIVNKKMPMLGRKYKKRAKSRSR